MDNIEHLYKCYEILSESGNKISEVSTYIITMRKIMSCLLIIY